MARSSTKMIKEHNTTLNPKDIIYDVDIIKDIIFTSDKIILSSYKEKIILEYYFKEIFNPILFKYENTFKNVNKIDFDNGLLTNVTFLCSTLLLCGNVLSHFATSFSSSVFIINNSSIVK